MSTSKTKFYNIKNPKHLTIKTTHFFVISISILISLIFLSSTIVANDLIEVVLDETLDFETNNANLQHTKIYQEFNMLPNLTPINLFDLATNFPVNIDGYFDDENSQVKLKINQNYFNNIKQSQPENLLINIPVAVGKNFTLALKKSNPLSDDFQFKDAQGNSIAYDEGLHYHGIVKDNGTSWVAVSIFDNYVRALFIDYKGIYILSAVNHFDEHYLLYNDKKLAVHYFSNLSCAVNDQISPSGQRIAPGDTKINRTQKTSANNKLRISIESDYAMFEHQGNFQNVYNYTAATLNEAAILFENDDIYIELSEIVAWGTEDTYDENYTSTVLQQFADRRKNNFNGDLLHLFTSEYLDRGGLANVNVLGKCYTFFPDQGVNYGPYGLSVVDYWICTFGLYHYDVWTFVHEIGHNLGSRHTHLPVWEVNGVPGQALDNANVCYKADVTCFDQEAPIDEVEKTGGTIMSYYVTNDFGISFYRGFGDQPGEVIRSSIDAFFNKGCMDNSACNFDPTATTDDGSCIFGNALNDDSIFEEIPWLNGKVNKDVCGYESIIVYKNAGENSKNVLINKDGCLENYDCDAELMYNKIPDFSTIEITNLWTCRDCNGNKKGCMYANACNYNPSATVNNAQCDFGETTCPDGCNNNCTCLNVKEVSNSNHIFNQYTWLADSINYNGICNFKQITEYAFSSSQFLNIEFNDGTAKLFSGDGQFNCTTSLCENCLEEHVPDLSLATITCWTCGEPDETCDATGVVKYQVCDGGQWYYLIETTDGEILDPYNDIHNINFVYPNGAVVNFSYEGEFPSECEYAQKAVNINCIEEVDFPCNYTHSGTVIFRNCDDGLHYFLIEMDDGRILDPYNSSAVNFTYVEGDIVEFEYLSYNQTYCNLSDEAGIITCIRSVACNNMGIVFYEDCNNSNYLIRTTDGSIIEPYDQSGTNFSFQDGDVVQFGYSSTYATSCSQAAYGVYLSCIESIELPCTNTGTVFSQDCDGTTYTLINMDADGVLDPYLSPAVDFQFEEGAFVEFAYMPIPYSPCSAALQSGIITCIQNTCRNNTRIINSVPIANGIHSNAKHIITYGEVHQYSNVELKAPRITMQTGFKVKAGATFKAINNTCE